jgi:hypothetical protein
MANWSAGAFLLNFLHSLIKSKQSLYFRKFSEGSGTGPTARSIFPGCAQGGMRIDVRQLLEFPSVWIAQL